MIKSKNAKLISIEPTLLVHNCSQYVGTNELINETEEFLNVYYKGAFEYKAVSAPHRNAIISLDSFAAFIKTVFCAVCGKDLIGISVSLTPEHIKFTINLNTSLINEQTKDRLEALAHEALTEMILKDGTIELKAKLDPRSSLSFSSVSNRRVYRAFYNEFFVKK